MFNYLSCISYPNIPNNALPENMPVALITANLGYYIVMSFLDIVMLSPRACPWCLYRFYFKDSSNTCLLYWDFYWSRPSPKMLVQFLWVDPFFTLCLIMFPEIFNDWRVVCMCSQKSGLLSVWRSFCLLGQVANSAGTHLEYWYYPQSLKQDCLL